MLREGARGVRLQFLNAKMPFLNAKMPAHPRLAAAKFQNETKIPSETVAVSVWPSVSL